MSWHDDAHRTFKCSIVRYKSDLLRTRAGLLWGAELPSLVKHASSVRPPSCSMTHWPAASADSSLESLCRLLRPAELCVTAASVAELAIRHRCAACLALHATACRRVEPSAKSSALHVPADVSCTQWSAACAATRCSSAGLSCSHKGTAQEGATVTIARPEKGARAVFPIKLICHWSLCAAAACVSQAVPPGMLLARWAWSCIGCTG